MGSSGSSSLTGKPCGYRGNALSGGIGTGRFRAARGGRKRRAKAAAGVKKGRLRVHDAFELIRWLVLSQPDPRKALAELVPNSQSTILDALLPEVLELARFCETPEAARAASARLTS